MPDLDFAGRYDAGDLHKSRCEGTGCPLGATDEPLAVEPVQAKERWCDQDLFASLIDQLGSPGFPSGAFRLQTLILLAQTSFGSGVVSRFPNKSFALSCSVAARYRRIAERQPRPLAPHSRLLGP